MDCTEPLGLGHQIIDGICRIGRFEEGEEGGVRGRERREEGR